MEEKEGFEIKCRKCGSTNYEFDEEQSGSGHWEIHIPHIACLDCGNTQYN